LAGSSYISDHFTSEFYGVGLLESAILNRADVLLIGAGAMSTTLESMLKQLTLPFCTHGR